MQKRLLLLFLISYMTCASTVCAQNSFSPNITLGDGKNGSTWQQWKQNIPNQSIITITAKVRKISGASNTFVNLRFGNGAVLENGKQFFVTDGSTKTITWNLSGASSNNKPLVMNAYNGEVQLQSLNINYKNSINAPRRPSSSIRTSNPRPLNQGRPANALINRSNNEREVLNNCRNNRVRRPRIEINRVRSSGGFLSGKRRIEGNIFGACVEEAAYFENGRVRGDFEFPFSDRFQRKEFSIQVRGGRNGQIRVYTVNGREEIIDVDALLQEYN